MSDVKELLEELVEEDFLNAQENVEVMRETEGSLVHVRMIAYDDLN